MQGSIDNKEPRISGIVNNNSQKVKHYTSSPTSDYWTPLDSQVEELGSSHEQSAHHMSHQSWEIATLLGLIQDPLPAAVGQVIDSNPPHKNHMKSFTCPLVKQQSPVHKPSYFTTFVSQQRLGTWSHNYNTNH